MYLQHISHDIVSDRFGTTIEMGLSSVDPALAGSSSRRYPISWEPQVVVRTSASIFFSLAGLIAGLLYLGGTRKLFEKNEPTAEARLELIACVGSIRPVEGRIVGLEHADYEGASSRTPEGCSGQVRRIRKNLDAASTAKSLADAALVDLLFGQAADAVLKLEKAVVQSPSADFSSDLAAAYLATAKSEPYHYVLAAAAALEALKSDSLHEPAHFNYALALEGLSLRESGSAAWDSYTKRFKNQDWAKEAQLHLSKLRRSVKRELWSEDNSRLVRAVESGTKTIVQGIVNNQAQAVRQYTEEVVLMDWALAQSRGNQVESSEALKLAKEIGEHLRQVSGDLMVERSVGVITRMYSNPIFAPGLSNLAEGHRFYGQALGLYRAEKFADARALFAQSQARFKEAGSPFEGWASFQLALCDYQHARYPQAELLLATLTQEAMVREFPNLAARSLWVAGLIRYIEGDLGGALKRYLLALSLFKKTKEGENLAAVQALISECLGRLGDAEGRWEHLGEALRLSPEIHDPRRWQIVFEEAAGAALAAGQPQVAVLFLDELLNLLSDGEDWAGIAQVFQKRAAIEHELGRNSEALQDLGQGKRFSLQVEDPVKSIIEGDILLAESRIVRQAKPQHALDLLGRALALAESTKYTQRVPVLHLERALAHRLLGARDAAERDLEIAIESIERQRNALDAEALRTSYFEQAQRVFDEMISLQAAQGDAISSLEYAEMGRARSLLDLRLLRSEDRASERLRVEEIYRELPADVALVYYAILEDQLLIWLVRREGVILSAVEVRASDIVARIERFTRAIEIDGPGFEQAAVELYRLLIGPLAGRLEGHALVFIPDKDLARVPFAALKNSETKRYLVQDHDISVAPSGNVYLANQRRGSASVLEPGSSSLLVGNPRFDADLFQWLRPLPGAEREVQKIARLLPGAKLLTGRDAGVGDFLRLAAESEVIHLAAHAIVDREAPLLSGFVMAPGSGSTSGLLRASDLYKADLSRTNLVVLSACATALGEGGGREGVMNLARPFVAAGVPSVVATLWPIEDEASSDLLTAFYLQLKTERGAVAALRQVQVDAIETNGKLSGPKYWAAFQHLGGGG